MPDKARADRERFLEQVDAGWARLMAAVRAVPRGRMDEPGVSGSWSVKDLAGHVATWDRLILGVVKGDREARRQATAKGVDGFNAAEAESKRGLSAGEALRELEAAHATLRSVLDSVPAEVFAEGYPARKALHDDTHLHYAEHAADIERWAKTPPPARR